MRITNKIMQANALSNINKNKELQDKLNTQITTQSKITKPSDDPVIAIRALRLRTNLSEITQYYEKNVPDAEHWLAVTEDSLNSMTEVITDMYEGCVNASKQYLEADDRLKIIENMKALREEVYSTGDASYAGRNIFTGYRTDVSLGFEVDQTLPYEITELVNEDSISTFTYVDTNDILDVNQTNFGTVAATEPDVESSEVHRIRLAYDDCSSVAPTITYGSPSTTVTATVMSAAGAVDPYTEINLPANANAAIFVPETGDLLLGGTLHETLLAEGQERFQVSYEKEDWIEGDLRPEHYFACTSDPGTADEIIYNPEYMTTSPIDDPTQVITYDVSANQRLRVNTLATECFTHDIGLDVDELVEATESLDLIEEKCTMLEDMLEDTVTYTTAELADIQEKLDAANKAKILIGDKVQKMFEEGITLMQGYLNQTNLALTNSGNRSSQLELVSNRLESQQISFKELASDNEGADVTELAIQLSSAETSYDAALMATSKVIKNSLVEFI